MSGELVEFPRAPVLPPLVNLYRSVLSAVLEKNLRQLMECVDDVAMDTNKYLNFQRQNFRQTQAKQQYLQKRVSIFNDSNKWGYLLVCVFFLCCYSFFLSFCVPP